MWNFLEGTKREKKTDLLIDRLSSKEQGLYFMFRSARKLQTFNKCLSIAPRNMNVMFVRFSGTNGPKDSVFSFSHGACIVAVCFSLIASLYG